MIEVCGLEGQDVIRDNEQGFVYVVCLSKEYRTYSNGDKLPDLWVSDPLFDDKGNYTGRTDMILYCSEHDEHGENALYFGGCYYDEGMSYTNPSDYHKRIQCFMAADILYRHAAAQGNAVAYLCLGYVYSYDRTGGHYWQIPEYWGLRLKAIQSKDPNEIKKYTFSPEQRAFECFEIAAQADIPEACYKLGDMYKHGTGCEANAADAFHWYEQAAKLASASHERPTILGSIALRLASCYEEGFGCDQSFARALEWYNKAVAALEVAVENGDTWYEKALSGARAGEKRCQQEVTPC